MPIATDPMYFDLDIYKALFHNPGQYFLKIAIQGSPEKQNEVKLFINQSKHGLQQSQHVTDSCSQGDREEPIMFPDSKITFYIPPVEFVEDEILLIVEAYELSSEGELQYGEAVFLVYPPTKSLFSTKKPSENRANKKHVLYNTEKQLTLTTEESGLGGLSISVGVLWMKTVLRKADEEDSQEQNIPTRADKYNEVPGPSSLNRSVESIPRIPTPASGNIMESPLGPLSPAVHPRQLCGSYVAREGYCEVAVLVHGATGLPSKSDGHPPQPYVIWKSKRDHSRGLQARSVTHTSIQPTHFPSWNEVLLIEFPHEDFKQEAIKAYLLELTQSLDTLSICFGKPVVEERESSLKVYLYIADSPSKELLAEYRIPVSHLKPFYPYNLELVKSNEDLDSSSRLYVSLILKRDRLTKLVNNSRNIFGMEMLLRGFENPISNQVGPLIAVSRIVPDWNEYREKMLTSHPCTAGVTMTTIGFPSPHPTSFTVASSSLLYGSPQVTDSGEPFHQPQWNQMFYFPGEVESLFSNKASLVIEFYAASRAFSDSGWQLTSPVGYCNENLNQSLAFALQQQNASMGLRLNNLPIQGFLNTPTGRKASVGIVLRLLTQERPDGLVSASQFSSLPVFNENPQMLDPDEHPAVNPNMTTGKNPYGLPPLDAVQRILPLNKARGPSDQLMSQSFQQPITNDLPNPSGDPLAIPLELRSTMDLRTLALLDHQMKEVDRYRTAMRKLAADLLHLKQENARLEEANSQYRRDLNQHDEISRIMVGSNDLDNVTHTELIQKFVLLKKKLSDESTNRQELQKRTQKLQNDLIKKNEKEKELLKLQAAHESQQALLQKIQSKAQKYKAIQETCKKQEKVIVELEKLLSNGSKDANLSDNREVNAVYIEENTRLRLELEKYKERKDAQNTNQELFRTASPDMDTMLSSEKFELYQKLERSEGRILGLEKQLTENARKWAKEKTELQAKLNEMVLEQQAGLPSHFSQGTPYTPDVNFNSSSKVFPSGTRKPSPKLNPLERKRT